MSKPTRFRKGHVVRDEEGKVLLDAKSVNQAKRFVRTGSPGSDPAPVLSCSRVGGYIPKNGKSRSAA